MILVATVLYAAMSAFVPVTPIEPYLVGVVAATGANPVALGLAAAVGQTAGKVLIFLSARRGMRWLSRRGRHRAPNRLLDQLDRPVPAILVVLVSSLTGIPSLLVICVYAARTPMSVVQFAAACLVGRAARFVTVALAPSLVT
jgi:membrane protein YqaA with SNARE-associated domain